MSAKDVYDALGEDYEKSLGRALKEERMQKYFRLFLEDTSFGELEEAMSKDDMDAAFKAAHTLKGVAANLCFNKLSERASVLTEDLRNGADINHAKEFFPEVRKEYIYVVDIVKNNQ